MQSQNYTVSETPSRSSGESNNTFQLINDGCYFLARYSFRKVYDRILFGILIGIVRKIQSFFVDIDILSGFEQWFLKTFLGDFSKWVTVHVPVALHALECLPSCLLVLAFLAAWSLWKSNLRIANLEQELYLLDGAGIRYR